MRLSSKIVVLSAAALVTATVLTGCQNSSVTPLPADPTASGSSTTDPTGSATPAPAPTFDPEGTASDNKAFFDSVNTALIEEQGSPTAPEFVASLADAGFTRDDMEMTVDTTTVGVAADSVFFSVRMGGRCLVGEFGVGGYTSAVMAPVNDRCLVGSTVSID